MLCALAGAPAAWCAAENAAPATAGEESAVPTDGTSEATPDVLFNGKDFTGWKILGCTAEIDQGEMVITGGNGIVQTAGQYRDYVLELDWKAEKPADYDSGIYFRYGQIPEGSPWPDNPPYIKIG